MKKFLLIPIVLLIILIGLSMSSCDSKPYWVPLTVENVDDSTGFAEGRYTETRRNQITTYLVTVPYHCLSYDAKTKQYYLDYDRFAENVKRNPSLRQTESVQYIIKGKPTEKDIEEASTAVTTMLLE